LAQWQKYVNVLELFKMVAAMCYVISCSNFVGHLWT